jgi:hypothetical protein
MLEAVTEVKVAAVAVQTEVLLAKTVLPPSV